MVLVLCIFSDLSICCCTFESKASCLVNDASPLDEMCYFSEYSVWLERKTALGNLMDTFTTKTLCLQKMEFSEHAGNFHKFLLERTVCSLNNHQWIILLLQCIPRVNIEMGKQENERITWNRVITDNNYSAC